MRVTYMYHSSENAKENTMNARLASPTTQDWRTADPVWADDVRPAPTAATLSTELLTASAGFLALLASVVAILA